MAYLDAQRDGRSWHSPRQCIPGGGWKITAHTVVKTKTADGKPFAYNRMIIENGSDRQLVYYWYDQRGRKVANEFVMKFWLIYDAVMRKRSDSHGATDHPDQGRHAGWRSRRQSSCSGDARQRIPARLCADRDAPKSSHPARDDIRCVY
ncbi:MAG: EpsI family protein [Parvularculaceae bacterium]